MHDFTLARRVCTGGYRILDRVTPFGGGSALHWTVIAILQSLDDHAKNVFKGVWKEAADVIKLAMTK